MASLAVPGDQSPLIHQRRHYVREFRDFISEGNVIDLAVAVVIGGAFGAIVNSLVNSVFSG